MNCESVAIFLRKRINIIHILSENMNCILQRYIYNSAALLFIASAHAIDT